MRQDLTDITIVLDRSGSMRAIKDDAEGGLNEFIEQQKKLAGEALFTLVQFDTEYEFVHKAKPIREVGHCELDPRGYTALLDALGRAINETGERLKAMDEKDRPGLVVFVIITDGNENASKEFHLAQVREMIKTQSETFKWQFTYLGANQDAFAEAGGMGIGVQGSSGYAPEKSKLAFAAAGANVGRMRHAVMGGQAVVNAYTDKERKDMEK